MSKGNILIVEDNQNLGNTLTEYLDRKGFSTKLATNVAEAMTFFQERIPDIILMDIGLPDGDGLTLAKSLRQASKRFVLFFLSAQNDPQTRFEGLELGAEDYITKPFDLRELMLRLERVLNFKQEQEQQEDKVKLGDLTIYFKQFEVQDAQGNFIALSQKECLILKLLYTKLNQVVSRDAIIDYAWGENQFPSNRTVDNYIVKLRKWLETSPGHCAKIISVRGIGYRLEYKEQE